MNKETLWKHVDRETDWLAYYSHQESSEKLNMDEPLYDQLVSIGYTKVVTPLDIRCNGWLCFEYTDGMTIEDLVPLMERRNSEENKFTPVEIWVKLFPEDKELIYKRLNKMK
jgi:hypothetical protein